VEVHQDGQLTFDHALREVVVVLHVEGRLAACGVVEGAGQHVAGRGGGEEQRGGGGAGVQQGGRGGTADGEGQAEVSGGERPDPTEEEPLSHL